MLVFQENTAGSCSLMEVIQSNGTAFEQVEYVNFDEKPGLELVIGRQVSDQVLRSVSVYSFSGGSAELMLMSGYSKFITTDLNENGRSELLVLSPGEVAAERGRAVLYNAQSGKVKRSVELELSVDTSHIRRITKGRIYGGAPAVYIASAVDESTVVTDVLALQRGKIANISYNGEYGASIQTLRNFYVYPEDIDADGILELPAQVFMRPVSVWAEDEQKFLLRWYAMDSEGREVDKLYSFHDYIGGWYVKLDKQWASRISVEEDGDQYTFYVWNESNEEATALFTIYLFTGSTRDADAAADGRFALYRTEDITYSGKLERYADQYDITEKHLIESFSLIRNDWQTGET